jgi:hypothetical protein
MQMIFARMMRGELGVALQAMRIAMADEKRAGELAALNAAAGEQLKHAGFRNMKAIMMRLAKGETAMFLEIWRTNKKWAARGAAGREAARVAAREEARAAAGRVAAVFLK